MSQTMMPAAWSALFAQIKPFGETDFSQVLRSAGELLGFSAAQIDGPGRMVARIGGLRDVSTASTTPLPHSESSLSIHWTDAPTTEQELGTQSLANMIDLALIAEDRRSNDSCLLYTSDAADE